MTETPSHKLGLRTMEMACHLRDSSLSSVRGFDDHACTLFRLQEISYSLFLGWQDCIKRSNRAATNYIVTYSITCDGYAANITTLSNLGCAGNPQVFFQHSNMDHRVHVTLDIISHAETNEKLSLRYASVPWGDSQSIQWHFIGLLADIQGELGLKFRNKLGQHHIKRQKAKMKVKLSA